VTSKAHGGAIRFAHPDKPGREDRRHASELDAGRQLKARALSDLPQHVRQICVAQIHRELSIAQCDDRSQS